MKISMVRRGARAMTETRRAFERCMVDTNVLVYATIDEAPRCEEARQWMRHLQKQGVQLCTTLQVYREYLVVLTRGSIFERTFTVTEALAALEALRPAFRELSPTSETFTALTHLVRRYEVRGKQVHDANIVAVMVTYGMDALATYNRGDFQRFEEVTLLTPE